MTKICAQFQAKLKVESVLEFHHRGGGVLKDRPDKNIKFRNTTIVKMEGQKRALS
jgi:hypothetical protein